MDTSASPASPPLQHALTPDASARGDDATAAHSGDARPRGGPPRDVPPRDIVARVLPAVAILVMLLSLIPVADLIPGGFKSDEWRAQVDEWISGSAVVLGGAALLAIVSRSVRALWPVVAPGALDDWAARRRGVLTVGIALAALAGYVLVAHFIAGGLSLLIDEMAQTIQARIFATGRLWAPVPRPEEFFTTQHMLFHEGRQFSQFPPGGPGVIALGTLVGAEWLVGPLFAFASVFLWASWLRRTGEPPATAMLALALFALAPFTLFMSGTRMNHVMTTTLILGASVALLATVRADRSRPLLGLVCGLCYGLAATLRPVDAASFALPGGAWLLALAYRDRRRVPDLLLSGVGVALPLLFVFWFNAQTTGAPTLFGYQLLWGHEHDLGFHMAPWGKEHTPVRGVELVANYFLLLQRHFLETPVPALLAVCGAFLLVRRVSGEDRYLLAAALILIVSYWAYWHAGKFMGPRFMVPLTPMLALWTARFPGLLREWMRGRLGDRFGAGRTTHLAWRGAVYAMLLSLAIAGAYAVPLRWKQYAHNFAVFRWDPKTESAKAGVRDALVLVREGWESQLVVRMWGLGISHPRSELYYRAIDACRLESTLGELERQPRMDSTTAIRRLDGLVGDSLQVVSVRLRSGFNVRVQQGAPYSARCLSRIRESETGVIALAPIVAAPPDGNVYARDLHARDTLLVARYPNRPIWLLGAESHEPNALPKFFRVDRDSLVRAWREEATEDLRGGPRTGIPLQLAPKPDSSAATR